MLDDVHDLWLSISATLAENAPRTAACLNGPASQAALAEVRERSGRLVPESLLQSLACHDGMQLLPLQARLFPPSFIPYEAAEMMASYHLWAEITEAESADSWNGDGVAGESRSSYSSKFWPIATDSAGDEYFIDLRDGDMHGSVCCWYQSSGAVGEPLWGSVSSLLSDVASALTAAGEGKEGKVLGCRLIFEEQAVKWCRV